MEEKPTADRKGAHSPLPEPMVLTTEELQQIAGGLNPQPLPPGADHCVHAE